LFSDAADLLIQQEFSSGFSAVFLRKKAEELTPQLDGRRPLSVTLSLAKDWRKSSLKKAEQIAPSRGGIQQQLFWENFRKKFGLPFD